MKTKLRNVVLFILTIFLSQFIYSQDVPYVPTPYEVVDGMLELAKVVEEDIVYDLGCGDGRIVVQAAKKYGTRGVGVDSDPQRIKESNQNAKENMVTDKVKFYEKNLFETDLTEATVVTIYLLSEVNIKLRPKLFRELKPGSRVVSNSFDMDDWEPEKREVVGNRNLYLWIMPFNFSGKWQGTISGNNSEEEYLLELNQEFQKVSGNLQIGKEKLKITDAKLDGNNLRFNVKRKVDDNDVELMFEGKLIENELKGEISAYNGDSVSKENWVAQRDPNTIMPLDPAILEKQQASGKYK
jgi:SAM-dependent methyltransferase